MCLASKETSTRPARVGEDLVFGTAPNHWGTNVAVVAPVVPEPNVLCAYLKRGTRVQFANLPEEFQRRHAVGADVVADFVTDENGDRFDFLNGEVEAMERIPKGARIEIRDIPGQPRLPVPNHAVTNANRQPGLPIPATLSEGIGGPFSTVQEPDAPVPAGVWQRVSATTKVGVGVALSLVVAFMAFGI